MNDKNRPQAQLNWVWRYIELPEMSAYLPFSQDNAYGLFEEPVGSQRSGEAESLSHDQVQDPLKLIAERDYARNELQLYVVNSVCHLTVKFCEPVGKFRKEHSCSESKIYVRYPK